MMMIFRRFFRSSYHHIRQSICRHEFLLSDLKTTGLPEPAKPDKRDWKAWNEWWRVVMSMKHESHTKRVMWPCRKCEKVFFAHCGLDISPKYGRIVQGNDTK